MNYDKPGNNVTFSQAISLRGDVNLSKKWKLNVFTGIDLKTGKISTTSIDIYRDLHCWEMSFNWQPIGFRQSFMLTINVKSAMLQDLKLTRRRNWMDFQ